PLHFRQAPVRPAGSDGGGPSAAAGCGGGGGGLWGRIGFVGGDVAVVLFLRRHRAHLHREAAVGLVVAGEDLADLVGGEVLGRGLLGDDLVEAHAHVGQVADGAEPPAGLSGV